MSAEPILVIKLPSVSSDSPSNTRPLLDSSVMNVFPSVVCIASRVSPLSPFTLCLIWMCFDRLAPPCGCIGRRHRHRRWGLFSLDPLAQASVGSQHRPLLLPTYIPRWARPCFPSPTPLPRFLFRSLELTLWLTAPVFLLLRNAAVTRTDNSFHPFALFLVHVTAPQSVLINSKH